MVAAYFNAVQRRMRVILNLTVTTARAHGHVTWMSLCGATLPITMVRRQCVLQCVAVCCSVLQCVATWCSKGTWTSHFGVTLYGDPSNYYGTEIMHCSALQCVVACCSKGTPQGKILSKFESFRENPTGTEHHKMS